MKAEKVIFFDDREEECAVLLVRIGIRKNVAMVLVYLANIEEATSREIERGTDLRQPEISIAMNYLQTRDWITSRESNNPGKGRPCKIYNLAKPFSDILGTIGKEKQQEVHETIQLTEKLREYSFCGSASVES